jgi:hypothetical protein
MNWSFMTLQWYQKTYSRGIYTNSRLITTDNNLVTEIVIHQMRSKVVIIEYEVFVP